MTNDDIARAKPGLIFLAMLGYIVHTALVGTPREEILERHHSMNAAHPDPVDWNAMHRAMFGRRR